jgi:hypothetical protein
MSIRRRSTSSCGGTASRCGCCTRSTCRRILTGYGYTQYVAFYNEWAAKQRVVMRQVHKAGDKCFVDYSGTSTIAAILQYPACHQCSGMPPLPRVTAVLDGLRHPSMLSSRG